MGYPFFFMNTNNTNKSEITLTTSSQITIKLWCVYHRITLSKLSKNVSNFIENLKTFMITILETNN